MSRDLFLDLAPHEMDVHFIFDSHGLKPYFALDSIRKEYDAWQTEGKPTATMQFDGDTWGICYDYDKMEALAPRSHPDYHLESVPQFRLYFVARDGLDDGERADRSQRVRGGTATIRPRWPDMRKTDGEPVRGVPNLGHPYIDVQVQASNIDHEKYHDLVKRLFGAFDINERYVGVPHEMSNVGDLAVYARVRRGVSDPLYAPDGPIARTHSVLEGGMSGYRSHSEDHRKIPGYHVATVLDDERTRDVLRGSRLGKEIKHYYPLNPEQFEPDEPLYHPKLEVSYQTSVTEETVRWSEIEDAVRELEETLYNYLEWADLPVRADGDVFVSDEYFKAGSESERNVRLHSCPLPEIEDEQEAAVMKLWGSMESSDRDLIDSLIADGGKPSRQELSDRTGWSYRTVRRFVQRCEDVVSASFDGVEIASKYQQDLLLERVRASERNFRKSVEDAVMKAADAASDRQRSRWSRVKQSYGLSVRDGDFRDEIKVRYRPSDREDEISMIQEIRNAARSRYNSLRGLAVTMTKWDGSTYRIPSLDAWKTPVPVQSRDRDPRTEWLADYLGCDPREATEDQRKEATRAYRNAH